MVFIRPNDTHDYLCENGKVFSMMNITFTRKTAEELFEYLADGFPSNVLLKSPLPPTVHLSEHELEWFNSHMDSICSIEYDDKSRLKSAVRILLFKIFTRFYSDISSEYSDMPLWLDRLLDKMRQNGNYIIGVEQMLKLSNKSREHTLRSIKKHTGMTATEYINGLRLNFISNMLKNSNHSIADIVFESGFNNLSWASSQFKKKFGVTMSDYRRENQ